MLNLSNKIQALATRVRHSRHAGQVFRFLLVGTAITAMSCIIYWLFVQWINHTLAYGVAFVIGTAVGAISHANFTFGTRLNNASFTLSFLYYFLSFLVGTAVLELAIRGYGVNKNLAIIFVVAVTVPVSFLANRWIFRDTNTGEISEDV